MDNEKTILALLRQKKIYMLELLGMTKDKLKDSGDIEKNAENYVALVDMRDELINKIGDLEGKIVSLSDDFSKADQSKEPTQFFASRVPVYKQEINEIAEQIIKLEREFCENAPQIMDHYKQKMRIIKNQKRVNIAYDK